MAMPLADYVAAKVGTRQWCVAPRLTDNLRSQGYTKAITQKRFTDLKAEHAMQGAVITIGKANAR